MKTVDIIERIEGEAKLKLTWKNDMVHDAQIDFLNFRGYEYILKDKPVLDALIYTPRICGICGQAHLLATVNAIENLYKNANIELEVSPKAKILRELGLALEIIDSHIKWFYMFIMPDVVQLSQKEYLNYQPLKGSKWLQAQKAASETIKALAIFSGQWPHTSYMLPGGVMSDPTLLDMITIENYIDQAINYYETSITGISLDSYLSFNNLNDIDKLKGDLKDFNDISFETSLTHLGQSYNRHLALSDMFGMNSGKIKTKNVLKVDPRKINESDEFTFDISAKKQNSKKHTWSKTVKYDSQFYEVGPLSRTLINQRSFIKEIHNEYEDSVFTRVMARMDELGYLLNHCKSLLSKLEINEPSYIEPQFHIKNIDSANASSIVEACRGSLYHDIEVNNGKISKYDVITPTVWNLGSGSLKNPGVTQNAIIGAKSSLEATIILRSFDVCSVCTTH